MLGFFVAISWGLITAQLFFLTLLALINGVSSSIGLVRGVVGRKDSLLTLAVDLGMATRNRSEGVGRGAGKRDIRVTLASSSLPIG